LPWTIKYLNATKKQLRRLDPKVRTRIFDFLDERIAESTDPHAIGDALTGVWKGHWRYRVGNYRVICAIRGNQLVIHVVRVGHRSSAYDAPPELVSFEDLEP
jgi:mRNA interferase RelE/StbE